MAHPNTMIGRTVDPRCCKTCCPRDCDACDYATDCTCPKDCELHGSAKVRHRD